MSARKPNVTRGVEEELPREERAEAAQESRRLAALERIQPLLDHPSVQLGEVRPSRDELQRDTRLAGAAG